ncbi:conserved hypothetical protein [Candidatus Desulfosporosinus infrequens]|uniref:Uncharacterized protein n=1 Tax=Candidatus Desulfosporosinus infrequens TaxID=2043169 RepID=A0A2U3LC79_9FIRM|nr:conserved hypothetical protein [Candidatus Desulfosporosinus infrequens]
MTCNVVDEQTIDDHLSQALSHIETAINSSIIAGIKNPSGQKLIGQKWELFLGQFFEYARVKGKEQRVNLLGWISFPRIRH